MSDDDENLYDTVADLRAKQARDAETPEAVPALFMICTSPHMEQRYFMNREVAGIFKSLTPMKEYYSSEDFNALRDALAQAKADMERLDVQWKEFTLLNGPGWPFEKLAKTETELAAAQTLIREMAERLTHLDGCRRRYNENCTCGFVELIARARPFLEPDKP